MPFVRPQQVDFALRANPATTQLYRVDEILLRFGAWSLSLVVLLSMIFVSIAAVDVPATNGRETVFGEALWIATRDLASSHGLTVALAIGFPVAALSLGWKVRRREKRILAIWRLLRLNAQIDVSDLVTNSHFEMADLERAIKLLNTRGLGHYIWDRQADTIQDGRLRTTQLHVEKCEACGGSISLEVPIGFSRVPTCDYCGDPVSIDGLEERRREALEKLQDEYVPRKAQAAFAVPFSLPLFAILAFIFWPAAIFYAWHKCTNPD